VHSALEQARGYADAQHVSCIAISDGVMLYAADLAHGGLADRLSVTLDRPEPPEVLWWLSVHGIYRPREGSEDRALPAPAVSPLGAPPDLSHDAPVHPKYHLPVTRFAYTANAMDPHSWKLPYLHADGRIDEARLPKAIQAVISNYRGAKVGGIPEPAIPDVLVRLALAAKQLGRLPGQDPTPARVYQQLLAALEQMGRLGDVTGAGAKP
jgi:hypothetical protein